MKTIVAPATSGSAAALAVLRVSGPAVREICLRYLGKENPEARRMTLSNFEDLDSKKVLDRLLWVFMPGPDSYTGEDVLEIFPHGNPLIVRSILRSLLTFPDCHMAEAGEFTRRAFENGRMDLLQAEAVAETIHAQTDAALENARRMQKGELSSSLKDLVEKIRKLSAQVELDVDFAEEEADANASGWKLGVENLLGRLEQMEEGFKRMREFSQVPTVVFFGLPNAGKSSLVNALLKEDRLLVSEKAGTTRDWVESRLHLPGGEVRLVDTAGLGKSVDALDAASMERTRRVLERAKLKVLVLDGRKPEAMPLEKDAALLVCTRADLPEFCGREDAISVSSLQGSGLSELEKILNKKLFSVGEEEEEAWIFSERQLGALRDAKSCLERLLASDLENLQPELVAFELQETRRALESLTGVITAEDVLNSIFSDFCIGK